MPRRAVMHRYPLVGRFAEFARKRGYLWSAKYEQMRPSFYVGSILSLLPVMGLQLPLALLFSVLLRANFMVMGGLQFITNPFTAAPIYYATHQVGAYVIRTAGFGHALPAADPKQSVLPLDEEMEGHEAPPPRTKAELAKPSTARRIGTAINALIVGGIVTGGALGLLLDILYRNFWQRHTQVRRPPRPPSPPP